MLKFAHNQNGGVRKVGLSLTFRERLVGENLGKLKVELHLFQVLRKSTNGYKQGLNF